jgi:hypothetical protein
VAVVWSSSAPAVHAAPRKVVGARWDHLLHLAT